MAQKFIVRIEETLAKSILVEAESSAEAEDKVRDLYFCEGVILSSDDYVDTSYSTEKYEDRMCYDNTYEELTEENSEED